MPDKQQKPMIRNQEISLDALYIPKQTAAQIAIANLKDNESLVLGKADFPDCEGVAEKHVTITYHHYPHGNGSHYIIQNGWQGTRAYCGAVQIDYMNVKSEIKNSIKAYPGIWIAFGEASIEIPANVMDYAPEVLALGDAALPNFPKVLLLNENNTYHAVSPYGEYIVHTDRGIGTKKANEDCAESHLSPKGELRLNVIDAMGGYEGAEVAVTKISQQFSRAFLEGEDIYRAVGRAGEALEKAAAKREGGPQMGACFVSAKIKSDSLIFYYIGDCKGIAFNLHSNDPRTKTETIDHMDTRMIDGKLKSGLGRALMLDNGRYHLTIPDESKTPITLLKDSWVVMGSDGLWKLLSVGHVKEIIRDFSEKIDEHRKAASDRGEEFNELLEIMRIINHKAKLVAAATGNDDNFTVILYRHNK